MCCYAHVSAGVPGGQKCQIHLELEVQPILSHLIWMLGPGLGSSGRALCAFNCWVISVGPCTEFYWHLYNWQVMQALMDLHSWINYVTKKWGPSLYGLLEFTSVVMALFSDLSVSMCLSATQRFVYKTKRWGSFSSVPNGYLESHQTHWIRLSSWLT